jgi:hypothetical protein
LIVLAGSDPRPATLPKSGAGLHPLWGAKAVALRIGGRRLIDLLLDRLQASGHFRPIYVGGPARLLGRAQGGVRIIDTNGTFGENIQATLEQVTSDHPDRDIAVTTCDILPEVDELHRLMDDYHTHAPLDFWFPVIRAPEKRGQLGAYAWKPQYRMIPESRTDPEPILPGHLVIVNPRALRLPLIYRSFELAYRSRNTPIMHRLWLILRGVTAGLLLVDLRHVAALRLPTMTATVVFNGISLAWHLRGGRITQEELEDRLRGIFIRHRHRRRHRKRRGRVPLMHALSVAKDIDTLEEAEEATDAGV